MAGVTQTSREFNHPRITYHAENRTFDRLFKETSLAELKRVVQRKLGLSNNGVVLLSQIRSGKLIDLEDDDDFDAFRTVANTSQSVDVKVTVGQATNIAHEATEATSPANSEDIPETAVNAGQKRKVVFDEGEHPSEHSAIPPSKRRRNNSTSVPKSQTGISQSVSDEEVQQLSQPLPLPTTVEDTPTTTPEPTNNALPLPTPVPTQRPPAQPTEPVIGGTSSNAKEAEPKKPKSKKSADAVEEDELETNRDPKPTPGDKKKRKKKKKDVGSEDTLVESTTQSWNSKNKSKSKEAEAVNPFPQQLASVIDKSRVDAEAQEVAKGGKPKKKSKKGDTEDGDTAQIGAKANDSNNATKTAATKVKDGAKTLAKSTKTRGRAPTETPESVVDPESREPPKKRARSASVAEISDARTTLLRFNEEMKKKRQANNMPSKATTSSTTPNISRSANPPVLQKKTNASARKKPAEPTEKATTQVVSPKPPIQSKPPVQPSTIRQPAAGNESDSDDSLRAMHATAHLAQQRRYTELLEKPSLDISIEDVMRGPHRRRLTVDNALRADIAGQRDTQDIELEEDQVEEFRDRRKPFGGRRARSSSDSEMDVDGDGGVDETNDDVLASNTFSVPPIVQSASASSREDSPPSNAEHPTPIPVPAAPTEARSDISSSEVLVPETKPIADVTEAGVNTSVVPETPPPEDALPAVDGNAGTENSDAVAKSTPVDDVDPIEPTVPTPREGSPIEPASQAPRGTVIPRTTRRNGSQQEPPTVILPKPQSRRGKAAKTQSVTAHESVVRDSVVKMTRSRSKQLAMNTPAAPPRKVFPATSVPPPNAESSDPEDEQDVTPKATQNRSKENSQSKRETRRLSQAEWTALPVSSPTEAETVSMSDELRSSPARPGSPLFIPSETQPSFPFSQYQDIETQETQPPHSPDDSDDEAEVLKSVTTSRRPSMPSGYRGLSQIASQPKGKRFGLSLLPSSQPVRAKPTTTEDLYGKSLNLDSDSDDSDSDSGSDAGKSHIPKSRRAGKKV